MLLKKLILNEGENYLYQKLCEVFDKHKINYKNCRNLDQLEKSLGHQFDKKGVYYILGSVLPYRELEIWKKQTSKIYNVKLPNKNRKVKVVFLHDFIIRGWADYATVGVSYPSGWAKKDALFCIKDAYNQRSEKFKCSYLVHETQHFDDYKHFPKLEQIDLEYRAKLAELIMSKKRTYELLDKFIVTMNNNPSSPHAYAEYCLLRDLSFGLSNKKMVRRLIEWKKISAVAIRNACFNILSLHTKNLNIKGARRVRGIL